MSTKDNFSEHIRKDIRGYFFERRKHYRITKKVKVKYKFISQFPQLEVPESYEAVTKNISTTGLLLKAEIPKPEIVSDMMLKKIMVFLEIFLPGEKRPLKATAEMRWIENIDASKNAYSIGLKFVDMTQEDKNLLTKFILSCI